MTVSTCDRCGKAAPLQRVTVLATTMAAAWVAMDRTALPDMRRAGEAGESEEGRESTTRCAGLRDDVNYGQ